jgi:hypothetical protein
MFAELSFWVKSGEVCRTLVYWEFAHEFTVYCFGGINLGTCSEVFVQRSSRIKISQLNQHAMAVFRTAYGMLCLLVGRCIHLLVELHV